MLYCIGAGKTTTFKILTGDLSATSGTAAVAGYDINTSLREVRMVDQIILQFLIIGWL